MNRLPTPHGFALRDVIVIVAAIAGIILVILPQMARSRARSSRIGCTNNLKQVGMAFRLWSGDNGDQFPMHVFVASGGAKELAQAGSAFAAFLVMSNELSTPKVLFCPQEINPNRIQATTFGFRLAPNISGGAVPFTPINNLSYFVGLDAQEVRPDVILSGDDHFSVAKQQPTPGLFSFSTNAAVEWNIGRHRYGGNIGFADGAVQSYNSKKLREAFIKTGLTTNRLVMP